MRITQFLYILQEHVMCKNSYLTKTKDTEIKLQNNNS